MVAHDDNGWCYLGQFNEPWQRGENTEEALLGRIPVRGHFLCCILQLHTNRRLILTTCERRSQRKAVPKDGYLAYLPAALMVTVIELLEILQPPSP